MCQVCLSGLYIVHVFLSVSHFVFPLGWLWVTSLLSWFSVVFNASLKQSWQFKYITHKTLSSLLKSDAVFLASTLWSHIKNEWIWSFVCVFCVCRFYLISGGVPFIICGITAAINIENYGSGEQTPVYVATKSILYVLLQVWVTLCHILESLSVTSY